MTIAIKTATSPAASAAFTVTFGNFEKVVSASVTFDDPQVADRVFAAVVTYATNVVTITITKMTISATNTWGAAADSDFTGKVVRVVADCI